MPDYEKIAAEAAVEGEIIPPEDAERVQRRANEGPLQSERQYLPLDHEKYQGIGAAKGYKQEHPERGHNVRIQKVRYNHEALIDEIMANPTITQRQLAANFGMSEGWISTIYGSDAFQAALAKRRDDLTDPFLIASIDERLKGLVHQSLNVLAEKLETSRNADLALKSLDVGVKALGFGARSGGNTQNNQFVIQLPPKAESAEAWNESFNSGNMKQLPSAPTEEAA